jgi:hypothetical protein
VWWRLASPSYGVIQKERDVQRLFSKATYYGDNRSPGNELHRTRRGGNVLLRDAFGAAQGPSKEDRLRVATIPRSWLSAISGGAPTTAKGVLPAEHRGDHLTAPTF